MVVQRDGASQPVVVASHLPGEGHFASLRFRVEPVECRDRLNYWAGLARFWDTQAVIVNVEHDMEVTDEHVAALLRCPHALCSWAYECHWAINGRGSLVAAGNGSRRGAAVPHYLDVGEEWAEWSAIGLVKIEPRARTGRLRPESWNRLELAIEDAVARPWHVHWAPVLNHHHW